MYSTGDHEHVQELVCSLLLNLDALSRQVRKEETQQPTALRYSPALLIKSGQPFVSTGLMWMFPIYPGI